MLLALALVVCAAFAARLIYRYDLYDREPWYVVVGVMAVAAAVMTVVGPAEDHAIRWIGGGQPTAADMAVVAAVVEELARLVIVLALAFLLPKYFNDPMDGLIYGSVVGIGMALEEATVAAARGVTGSVLSTLGAEVVRIFGHLLMGGITGFGVGMIRRRGGGRSWIGIAAACVAVAVAVHFCWDYLALSGAMYFDAEPWIVPASIGLMVVSMGVYGALVVVGSRSSRAVFAPGSPVRVWGRSRGR